jgi:uroporphyrinogen-III synthase
MATSPLGGRGILVTRPARQAAGLARQIAVLGGTPVIVPAIVILPPLDRAPLDRALASLDEYDYAVFVSANAVEYGVGAATKWPQRLIAFAPGEGTATALAAVGIGPARVPETTQDSEGLLLLPELAKPAGKRIVVFRGEGGRELLADMLRRRGALVDAVECYRRTRPQSGLDGLAQALAEKRIDATTWTSSEGVDNVCALLDATARAQLCALPAFVPHARIGDKARALGFVDVVVTAAGDAGLIASLLQSFAR